MGHEGVNSPLFTELSRRKRQGGGGGAIITHQLSRRILSRHVAGERAARSVQRPEGDWHHLMRMVGLSVTSTRTGAGLYEFGAITQFNFGDRAKMLHQSSKIPSSYPCSGSPWRAMGDFCSYPPYFDRRGLRLAGAHWSALNEGSVVAAGTTTAEGGYFARGLRGTGTI